MTPNVAFHHFGEELFLSSGEMVVEGGVSQAERRGHVA